MPSQLAIDLGTCHTVAVLHRDGQAPRPVLFDGSPLLPSGVYRDVGGALVVGRDAVRMSTAAPGRFEPYPKRCVDDGMVFLGDGVTPVPDLFAAILRRVAAEVSGLDGGVLPERIIMTCPADWGPQRRDTLRRAAHQAGLGEVTLVEEPIAAATYCAEDLNLPVPPGKALLVFDFGGGTLDVTVVGRDRDGLSVLAVGGLADLGGVDVDAALVGHLGAVLSVRTPELWQRIASPTGTGELRDRQMFWAEVRAAKEMLSRAAIAPVHVPGRDDAAHLTREEMDRVAGPLIDRAVDETRRVLDRARVGPDRLAGILLVGGSSRIPLVATRLHTRFGVAPTVPEQPELPVALGALRAGTLPSVPQQDFHQVAQPPPRFEAPPTTDPFGAGPVVPETAPDPAPTADVGKIRRKAWVRSGLSLALVATLMLVFVWQEGPVAKWFQREVNPRLTEGIDKLTGNDSTSGDVALTTLAGFPAQLKGTGNAAVAAGGDRFFYAYTEGKTTVVRAVDAAGGAQKWETKLGIASADPRLRVVADVLVVDAERSIANGNKDRRAVLAVGDGKKLWEGDWDNHVDIAYYGTEVVVDVDEFAGFRLKRVNLKTGAVVRNRNAPGDQIIAEERVKPARTWGRAEDSGTFAPAGTFEESLGVDPNRIVELDADEGRGYVLNAKTLAVVKPGALPLEDEHWTVYDGLIVGQLNSDASGGGVVLAGYRLNDLGRAWRYDLAAGDDLMALSPCGQHVICVSIDGADDTRMIALDTRGKGTELWQKPIISEWSYDPACFVVGGKTLYGNSTWPFRLGGGGANTTNHVIDPANGTKVSDIGDAYIEAAAGDHVAQVSTDLKGGWRARLMNVTNGKVSGWVAVGEGLPQRIAVLGPSFAVLTKDRGLIIARAPGLT